MRVLLINPPRFKGIPVVRETRCEGITPVSVYPPLKFVYVAAFLEKHGFEVDILDCNVHNYSFARAKTEIQNYNPNIVIFSSSPPTMSYDIQIADICKDIDEGITTVLDDSHISPVMPEAVLNTFKNIDILIKGESEATTLQLVNNLNALDKVKGIAYRKDSTIINNEEQDPIDLDSIPFPAYHLVPVGKYSSITFARRQPFVAIITSVSCPYHCSFCIIGGSTVWRGEGPRWRAKSPSKVVDEIEYLNKQFKVKAFYFFDANFTINKKRVLDICRKIIERKLNVEWGCNSRVDLVDREILHEMKRAGCWNISYGIESGSEQVLKDINKQASTNNAVEIFKISKKLGLNPSASLIIGTPNETRNSIRQTVEYVKKLNPVRAQYNMLIPFPGTKMYEDLRENNLLEKEYSFSAYDSWCLDTMPVLHSRYLTSEELFKELKRINREFYFNPFFITKTLFRIRSLTEFITLFKTIKYLQ